MNAEHLFIITTSRDAQVQGSARGLMYKYIMRNGNSKIFVFYMEVGGALDILAVASKVEGVWAVSKPASTQELKVDDPPVNDGKSIHDFVLFADEYLDQLALAEKSGEYKRVHGFAAIIVSHGSSSKIADEEPEFFAQTIISHTEADYSFEAHGYKRLPVFEKIVFNVCKLGITLRKASDLEASGKRPSVDYWSAETTGTKKKPVMEYAFKGDDEFKLEVLVDRLRPSTVEFNCVFRFLNVYGRKFNKNIIVAGYDVAMTAADMNKSVVDEPVGDKKLLLSGRRMTLEDASTKAEGWLHSTNNKHKKFYKFTAGDGAVKASIESAEWSLWTDKK